MIDVTGVLSDRLVTALRDVEVADGALSARIGAAQFSETDSVKLRGELSRRLYEVLHAARPELDGPPPSSFRDPAVEAVLGRATPHRHTRAAVLSLGRDSDDGERAAVVWEGMRVWLPKAALADGEATGGDTVLVRVPATRPAISPGFLYVHGPNRSAAATGPVLRLYIHLERLGAAPEVWRRVLTALNDSGVPYQAKVSSSPLLYPRKDALVVYLGPGAWEAAEVVRDVADECGHLIGVGTSPYAHQIAPGVAVAFEPADTRPGRDGLSFGQHRCAAVAEALVAHALGRAVSRAEALHASFVSAGIDPSAPARNLDSPDVASLGLVARPQGRWA
ncbi:T3SS effector HopA1 family protein [Micromonospora sp. NPDC023888]|uniref:T3SS effector HopA1 family protein n=1 Tax=Micromonospora sp. NPDC023888 TaxID=3155607 RepID=UPI0033E24C35